MASRCCASPKRNLTLILDMWRNVPPYLLSRVKGIQESGIVGWWSGFVEQSSIVRTPKPVQKPEKATMSGHIVVIFMVLLLGYALSVVSIATETISLKMIAALLRNVVRLLQNVWKRCQSIFQGLRLCLDRHHTRVPSFACLKRICKVNSNEMRQVKS